MPDIDTFDLWENEPPQSRTEIKHLASLIVYALHNLAKQGGNKLPTIPSKISSFHSIKAPSIHIKDYLNRFLPFLIIGDSELIGMLILIDRYLLKTGEVFSLLNEHRLIAVALTVAQKAYSEWPINLISCSYLSGIGEKEMLRLEREFLLILNYELFITTEQFLSYKAMIVKLARDLEKQGDGPFAIYLTEREIAFQQAQKSGLLMPEEEKKQNTESNASSSLPAKPLRLQMQHPRCYQ